MLKATRRELMIGLGASLVAPSMAWGASNWNGRYLVLLELKGANDGLNTLVPYESDDYRKLRPTIGIARDAVMPIGESKAVGPLGLNTSLAALDPALGMDLAIIQGIGYPNQNRSHFKSIAIWETGGDGNNSRNTGWLVRSLEKQFGVDSVAAHGASLQGSLGLFAQGQGVYVSMARLNQLRDLEADGGAAPTNKLMQKIVKKKASLYAASSRIEEKMSGFSAASLPSRMPHGELAGQLTDVLRVIGSGTALPVMHVQHGSFDTHEGQSWQHPNLLQDLAQSIAAFRENLIRMGRWDDVLLLTYSEFGRRAAENGAEGTDHGTASVHFAMGGKVRPGLYGDHPGLDRLVDGDMVHTMDYRAMYERVCSSWLDDGANDWLGYSDDRLAPMLG